MFNEESSASAVAIRDACLGGTVPKNEHVGHLLLAWATNNDSCSLTRKCLNKVTGGASSVTLSALIKVIDDSKNLIAIDPDDPETTAFVVRTILKLLNGGDIVVRVDTSELAYPPRTLTEVIDQASNVSIDMKDLATLRAALASGYHPRMERTLSSLQLNGKGLVLDQESDFPASESLTICDAIIETPLAHLPRTHRVRLTGCTFLHRESVMHGPWAAALQNNPQIRSLEVSAYEFRPQHERRPFAFVRAENALCKLDIRAAHARDATAAIVDADSLREVRMSARGRMCLVRPGMLTALHIDEVHLVDHGDAQHFAQLLRTESALQKLTLAGDHLSENIVEALQGCVVDSLDLGDIKSAKLVVRCVGNVVCRHAVLPNALATWGDSRMRQQGFASKAHVMQQIVDCVTRCRHISEMSMGGRCVCREDIAKL